MFSAPASYSFLHRDNDQTNVQLDEKFGPWAYNDNGLQQRMPWINTKERTLTTSWWSTFPAPQGVEANVVGDDIVVSWEAPTPVKRVAESLTGFRIFMSVNGAPFEPRVLNTGGYETSATISGLKPGAEYEFRVAVLNTAGTGPTSSVSNSIILRQQSSLSAMQQTGHEKWFGKGCAAYEPIASIADNIASYWCDCQAPSAPASDPLQKESDRCPLACDGADVSSASISKEDAAAQCLELALLGGRRYDDAIQAALVLVNARKERIQAMELKAAQLQSNIVSASNNKALWAETLNATETEAQQALTTVASTQAGISADQAEMDALALQAEGASDDYASTASSATEGACSTAVLI